MSYTFNQSAVDTTQKKFNPNLNKDNFSWEYSTESRKNWPNLCHICDKGMVLLVLSSNKQQIYPDGKCTGFHFYELLMPFEQLTKAGYKCIAVSETGQAFVDEKSIEGSMAEKYATQVWKDKSHPIHDLLARIYKPDQLMDKIPVFNGIYTAGGHACVYDLPNAMSLKKLVAGIYDNGGICCFVCHGPALLHNLTLGNGTKLVQGKNATGFSTSMEDKMIPGLLEKWMKENIHTIENTIRLNGGNWKEPSNPMGEFTVFDGRLGTGVNPASAKKLADEMIMRLDKAMATGGTIDYNKITNNNQITNNNNQTGMGMDKNNINSNDFAERPNEPYKPMAQ